MEGKRTPAEALERLRKEAKRRLKAFRNADEQAVRWYRRTLPGGPPNPSLRDMQLAVARSLDFPGWTALVRALETPLTDPRSPEGIVHRFLDNACPDHHVRGKQDHRRAAATAMRLLEQHPGIARHDVNTAVVCGELDHVRAALAREPQLAVDRSAAPSVFRAMAGGANDLYDYIGPKGWSPLLYLAFTRLPLARSVDNSIEIARLLLEAGADPNAFYHAGDSHYTPMTGVAGEGEEDRAPHPRRDELTQLFLDFGANPYDIQVVYDLGFKSEYLWWLPMIYDRCVRTGRAGDWEDPEWNMLDMGGYGCGARWFLDHAVSAGKGQLASWCLEHGASANPPPAPHKMFAKRSVYENAVLAGEKEITELLVRHGATPSTVAPKPVEALVDAARRLDRQRVSALLREHPKLLTDPRPLFHAADKNRADMVELLIDVGMSPNVRDDKNTRPLNHAAWSNSPAVAKALVARGAEIDAVEENYGGTAFGNACHFLHRDVMDFLAPLTKDVWNLAYNGFLDRLRTVIEEEPARARVEWDSWSPLLWLPPHDEDIALETAKLFVAHGANPHLRASNGATPLARAEAMGMMRLAEYFKRLASGSLNHNSTNLTP